ncbi:hypothetical protein C8Q76DRAFT_444254 [Earliella scabrosa]|nr:hypothetical protein C8Q76DRAFT_444254 [Earliella scabrosa]
MDGILDPFSDLFPPFFDSPTFVFTFDSPSFPIHVPTPSTTSVDPPPPPTPRTSSVERQPDPPTRTVTHTEIHSASSTPIPPLLTFPTPIPTTVLHNVTATLTETTILTSTSAASSAPALSTPRASHLSRNAAIGISIGIIAAVFLGLSVVFCLLYRQRRRAQEHDEEVHPYSSTLDPPLTARSSGAPSDWTYGDTKRSTMLSVATTSTTILMPQSPVGLGTILEAEPETPLSFTSDDRMPLISRAVRASATVSERSPIERPAPREVDAGSVHLDAYAHEHYERAGSEIVEPLPPAYEDVPPRRPVVTIVIPARAGHERQL